MIGLDRLKDGAYLLEHPEGPCWVLIRKGRIVRAEQYVAEIDRIIVWPADIARQWQANIGLTMRDLKEGVMLAGSGA